MQLLAIAFLGCVMASFAKKGARCPLLADKFENSQEKHPPRWQ